jgi:hypothetical protein
VDDEVIPICIDNGRWVLTVAVQAASAGEAIPAVLGEGKTADRVAILPQVASRPERVVQVHRREQGHRHLFHVPHFRAISSSGNVATLCFGYVDVKGKAKVTN